jgi:hypothetical protein
LVFFSLPLSQSKEKFVGVSSTTKPQSQHHKNLSTLGKDTKLFPIRLFSVSPSTLEAAMRSNLSIPAFNLKP